MKFEKLLTEVTQQLELDFDTPLWAQKCGNKKKSAEGWVAHYKNIALMKNSSQRARAYRDFWRDVITILRRRYDSYQMSDFGVPEKAIRENF